MFLLLFYCLGNSAVLVLRYLAAVHAAGRAAAPAAAAAAAAAVVRSAQPS